MLGLNIVDINLTMSVKDFEQELQDCISNYSEPMNYSLKPMNTRMGKHMYKLVIDNCNNSIVEIIAERDDVTGDIKFCPLKLSNFNDSFYNVLYDDDISGKDEDPAMFAVYAFGRLCIKNKGDFAFIDPNGTSGIFKEGNTKKSSVALVDNDGKVYSCFGAKSVKGASEDVEFTVKKPIGEWLKENPDVQREISKYPTMEEKMNYIGKYLINAKIKEEIDSEEFTDIFCQAGIIGFSEQSVLNIYKLIM